MTVFEEITQDVDTFITWLLSEKEPLQLTEKLSLKICTDIELTMTDIKQCEGCAEKGEGCGAVCEVELQDEIAYVDDLEEDTLEELRRALIGILNTKVEDLDEITLHTEDADM